MHDQRFVEWHCDDNGALVVRARLSGEQGALVQKALELAVRAEQGVSAETSEPLSTTQRRADALALVAESFVAHGPAALRGGDRHLADVGCPGRNITTLASFLDLLGQEPELVSAAWAGGGGRSGRRNRRRRGRLLSGG